MLKWTIFYVIENMAQWFRSLLLKKAVYWHMFFEEQPINGEDHKKLYVYYELCVFLTARQNVHPVKKFRYNNKSLYGAPKGIQTLRSSTKSDIYFLNIKLSMCQCLYWWAINSQEYHRIVVRIYALIWINRYIYSWNLVFLNYVIY